jgi:hypothetical protein
VTEAVNIETIVWTPEQAARYHNRFLPGAPPVTVAALARHAAVHGPYLVAETAWDYALKAPVGPCDPPTKADAKAARRARRNR